MSTMPEQKPGRSEQVVETPPEFISAVKDRLHIGWFGYDLAASSENKQALKFFSEEDNSLVQGWPTGEWNWLNPPYGNIAPWVEKAYKESQRGVKVACLVPSSTGSNWWANWVDGKAYVTFLNGRLTFVGHTAPYPKDLVLLLYAPFLEGGSCVWTWK